MEVMRNRYFALRHGESEANQQGIIISDPERGIHQYGLTARGRDQVRLGLEMFNSQFEQPPVIVSSDFLRTKESADLAKSILGSSRLNTTSLLRERFFGPLEGTSNSRYQEVWDRDKRHKACPGVETPLEVWSRLEVFLSQMEWVFHGKDILLVSHGDTLQILIHTLSGGNPWHHRQLTPIKTGEVRAVYGA
jgi:broad specificity phosphatase PhoE